jgi:tRNA pseudouridine38-40 synthase
MVLSIFTNGIGGQQVLTAPALPTGGLHQIVWTYDAPATTGRLYVDGAEVAVNTSMTHTLAALGSTLNETHDSFHARFDAVAKTYEYRILRAPICSPFDRRFVHHHPFPLNEARMMEAAVALEGEHDFTSFATSDESDELGRSKVRRIFSSRLSREDDRLLYRVRGSGFLKHMVRNMAGVLIEVGKGNIAPADVLQPRDPGPTVPARGLFLVSVEYPDLPGP